MLSNFCATFRVILHTETDPGENITSLEVININIINITWPIKFL